MENGDKCKISCRLFEDATNFVKNSRVDFLNFTMHLRIEFWGQNIKFQRHGAVKYAGNSSFRTETYLEFLVSLDMGLHFLIGCC